MRALEKVLLKATIAGVRDEEREMLLAGAEAIIDRKHLEDFLNDGDALALLQVGLEKMEAVINSAVMKDGWIQG
eukprot:CAMPEP_0198245090 /NCGR_PEP_ID=MMETSP1446-20131203/39164_1 /TAXON_ID=1461542 ORGANISM="Unidentified sp, Strain CCMP2111" /NCGR_SAMPLE_ID=MMETSP1446 /ASSEMBLY_ACC=CAM_ASM_001112 /LENGTH=73 /DNA_ID=CAMNT_0043929223 /DNA_START=45 /DNA_END=262 /DNA_ORIENTATION=-